MLAQQFVNAISLGGVYALFALGFTLVFGVLNVLNLAHGAVFMLGAYAALQGVVLFRLPVLAAIVLAMVVTALAGWALDRMIFAPLRARQAPHLAPDDRHHRCGDYLDQCRRGAFWRREFTFSYADVALGGRSALAARKSLRWS